MRAPGGRAGADEPVDRERGRRPRHPGVVDLDLRRERDALGGLRQALPGHFAFAWADALAPTVDWSAMAQGALWSVGYAVLLVGVAVWRFLRRDVTS